MEVILTITNVRSKRKIGGVKHPGLHPVVLCVVLECNPV